MENITVKVNGVEISVPKGTTVLEAAHAAGFEIPTLCYMKEINEIGACRICVTEVNEGRGFRLVAGCVYPCSNNMEILTNSPKVIESRKKTLELILSTHDRKCLSCVRSGNCELQKLCKDYGVEDATKYDGVCVAVCSKTQGIGVIGANERGFKTFIGSAFDMGLGETSCVSCGQCIAVCPVGAISEKDYTKQVMAAIADPEKTVLVQTAPAVRAGLGEAFGLPIGTNVEGKMVAALRRLGFDKVFDTDFAADLTIMEEANEFIDRVQNGGKLPLITSCSPGWVKFCEHYYPDLLGHLSTCKSPQQMFGATAKTYWAEKMGIDPKNIVMVSIMPCTAKKFEIGRPDQNAAGVPDVDFALTTRELGRMIERAGINFLGLEDEKFDDPLGLSTGAAVIFGATGGVMEAALRTAVNTLTGETVTDLPEVRGTDGIKKATYNVGDLSVNVEVASGLSNARKVLDEIRAGKCEAQFIEIMACPGGCVNGGGQPQVPMGVRNFVDIRAERAKVLYNIDKSMPLRQSHENPAIKEVYKTFFEKPGSHKAHEVLHTSYVERKVNEI